MVRMAGSMRDPRQGEAELGGVQRSSVAWGGWGQGPAVYVNS